jgi:MoaA/NifB/PqqE/SkfB family radical SAM enzyme
VVLHGIGEPLLNVQLEDMILHTKSHHPSAVTLFNSNGTLLDQDRQRALIEAGLDECRVSLDAATPETYFRVRGVDAFETVVSNVAGFADRLREHGLARPRLSLWLTALRENLRQLPDLVRLAAEIGVPEVYVQRLVLTHKGLAQAEQSLHRQLRARENRALATARRLASDRGVAFRASGLTSPEISLDGRDDGGCPWTKCHRLWTTTYITAHGNVLPCCISPFSAKDHDALVLGNALETPFPEIWNGTEYVRRRARLHTSKPIHPCELCGTGWSL